MKPTVDIIVKGLLTQGYKEIKNTEYTKILENVELKNRIKIYSNNCTEPIFIIIKEDIKFDEEE